MLGFICNSIRSFSDKYFQFLNITLVVPACTSYTEFKWYKGPVKGGFMKNVFDKNRISFWFPFLIFSILFFSQPSFERPSLSYWHWPDHNNWLLIHFSRDLLFSAYWTKTTLNTWFSPILRPLWDSSPFYWH